LPCLACCSDLEERRAGEKGRVIRDDARKYPQRDAVVGGFAGGELGLKTFVERGDVPIVGEPTGGWAGGLGCGGWASWGSRRLWSAGCTHRR
jgi:hypothetical protein